jgi:protein O-mannosyl-transferase
MARVSQQSRDIIIRLSLAVVTVAIYWPVHNFAFTNYDDDRLILHNPFLRQGLTLQGLRWALTTPLDQWMPVTWTARMLLYQWFGLDAGAYHLVNVLFHAANTLLLFGILNRMTAAPWRSALVAALFALHPLHVEPVAWVTGLKDVLSTCLGLLTIWSYIRYVEQRPRDGQALGIAVFSSTGPENPGKQSGRPDLFTARRVYYALTLVFFALSVMAKPMMVTLPFVLLLLDYWPLGRTCWAKPACIPESTLGVRPGQTVKCLVKEKLPMLGLSVVCCFLTYWGQLHERSLLTLESAPLSARATNAMVSFGRYLIKMLWPTDLSYFYPYENWSWIAVSGSILVLLAVSRWVMYRARRDPHLLVGWLWYLGTLVPVIGLVPTGLYSLADRYTYLPLTGLFIMVAWGMPATAMASRTSKVVAAVMAGAVLGACAGLTCVQIQYWRDTETLNQHALRVNPNNFVAYINLGAALNSQGRLQDAIRQYEQALAIKPDNAHAHNNLGNALLGLNRVPAATEHLQEAVQAGQAYADAHNNLGVALARQNKLPEAIGHWEQALQLKPEFAEAHNNLGLGLMRLRRIQEAIDQYEQALRIKPDYADAHYNLGLAMEHLGRFHEAMSHYEQALRINPDYVEVQKALARLRFLAG